MQIWKSTSIFVFIWTYVEDFTLKHPLLFKICARDIYEKFVYKHSEKIYNMSIWTQTYSKFFISALVYLYCVWVKHDT